MKSQLFELDEKQLGAFRELIVVGDLHGDYDALQSVLRTADPFKDCIIFLGDYADRGASGVEVIAAIDDLLKSRPQNMFALKGNHEDYPESGSPEWGPWTLGNEVNRKVGDWRSYLQNKLKPFIQSLYLAIIVPGEILFAHGGVSSKIRNLDDLRHPTDKIQEAILWSDPFEGLEEHPNRRGAGVEFGIDVTTKVCKLLGVKRIVRSHQPCMHACILNKSLKLLLK